MYCVTQVRNITLWYGDRSGNLAGQVETFKTGGGTPNLLSTSLDERLAAMGALIEPLPCRFDCDNEYESAVSSGTQGNTPTKIIDVLDSVYGDSAPSFTTVKIWAAELKYGRKSLGDVEHQWEIWISIGFFKSSIVLQIPAFVWPRLSSASSSVRRLILTRFSPTKRGLQPHVLCSFAAYYHPSEFED
ncbi:hypothetical protein TNCV_1231811 [Trichonephila clavipes]|nr:hypothetical protein TNCV_1231811 [Trichonephila clavipes]